jgi:hypothetical protein
MARLGLSVFKFAEGVDADEYCADLEIEFIDEVSDEDNT